MNVLFIFTSSLFFLWVLRELFFWLTAWQKNEYRQDRFFATVKIKVKKFKPLHTLFYIGKWLLFFAYFFVIFDDDLLLPYQYLIVGFYLFQSIFLLKEIYRNTLKKPFLTLRATIIIFLTLATILSFFAIPLFDRFFWLLFVDLITPLVVGFFVLLFLFPIEIYNDWQVEKAGVKIRTHPKLLVIAVTGSSGKSLVKDYVAILLSNKFNVIKTDGKNNTAIGVARTILKKLESNTQIFVAEISAYQRGEIAMLCELIRPKIGILTAINNHYLSLFKTLENIKRTNYELVESLPKQGFCIFNGNNKNTVSLYKRSPKRKVLYANVDSIESLNAREIVAFNIRQKQKRTTFTIALRDRQLTLTVSASHHIDSLLPAIYLASYLGMTDKEIKREIALLK